MSTVVAAITPHAALVRTARFTGLFYLGLAITGMLGFLIVRPALFVPGDPAATLARLVDREGMARLGIALEMGIVLTQTLAALWFFRLFRSVDDFAAGAIAAFGLVNAVAVLASAVFLATALQVALAPLGPATHDAQLMYLISANFWQVGNLFFGLWLIPMGWCVLHSRWMPGSSAGSSSSAVPVTSSTPLSASWRLAPDRSGGCWSCPRRWASSG